jgi:hypothetical protein
VGVRIGVGVVKDWFRLKGDILDNFVNVWNVPGGVIAVPCSIGSK